MMSFVLMLPEDIVVANVISFYCDCEGGAGCFTVDAVGADEGEKVRRKVK